MIYINLFSSWVKTGTIFLQKIYIKTAKKKSTFTLPKEDMLAIKNFKIKKTRLRDSQN